MEPHPGTVGDPKPGTADETSTREVSLMQRIHRGTIRLIVHKATLESQVVPD